VLAHTPSDLRVEATSKVDLSSDTLSGKDYQAVVIELSFGLSSRVIVLTYLYPRRRDLAFLSNGNQFAG
jgi:hypothetical protein